MDLRNIFCLALLGWWLCGSAWGQQKVIFGEIHDTIRPAQTGKQVKESLRFTLRSGRLIEATAPVSNGQLYLLPKYERGNYLYDPGRLTLFTDFGSYRYLATGSAHTWFFFPTRKVFIESALSTKRVYRNDSTLFYRGYSNRVYTPAFERQLHFYDLTVARQNLEAPNLLRFGDNLAYTTTLWAGVAGFQMIEVAQFNSHEFVRINLPLIINQDNYRFEQNIGYGIADKRWKMSAYFTTAIENWQLGTSIRNDIEEAGNYFFQQTISPDERLRLFYLSRYDWLSEAAISARNKKTWISGQAGILRRRYLFADSLSTSGGFLRVQYELPFSGAYADFSNGQHEAFNRQHYLRLSTYSFVGKGQYFTVLKPIYYLSNNRSATIQVRAVADASLTIGRLSERLAPTISGNGIDFNTVSDATMETLMPTSLAARQSVGLHLTLQKTLSISSDLPYQPSLFIAGNANRVWNAVNLHKIAEPLLLGTATIGEVGVGVRNLFVFPLPVLRPAIGVGYFYGFYPGSLKDLNSGSLKFTLRFFN